MQTGPPQTEPAEKRRGEEGRGTRTGTYTTAETVSAGTRRGAAGPPAVASRYHRKQDAVGLERITPCTQTDGTHLIQEDALVSTLPLWNTSIDDPLSAFSLRSHLRSRERRTLVWVRQAHLRSPAELIRMQRCGACRVRRGSASVTFSCDLVCCSVLVASRFLFVVPCLSASIRCCCCRVVAAASAQQKAAHLGSAPRCRLAADARA